MEPSDKALGYWVARLDEALESCLTSVLAGCGLTRRQWQVLNTLADGPLPPAAVHEALRPWLDAPRSGARENELAALVGRGFISYENQLLALSKAGRDKHAAALEAIRRSRHELSAGIGIDEYAMALSVLQRMTINAERLDGRY